MSFLNIPIRKNSDGVAAGWWNILRQAGIDLAASAGSVDGGKNFILNSSLRFWQAGLNTTLTVGGLPPVRAYGADQFLAENSMPTNAAIRSERVVGVGTRYGYKLSVDTAVLSSGTYTINIPIDNKETNELLNKTVTFKVMVKAVGNITGISVNLKSNTSAIFTGQSDLGPITTVTINNSTFTEVTFTQTIVNEPTVNGMLWIRFAPSSASSGNKNDAGNGFIIQEPMLVTGNVVPQSFFPAYADEGSEFDALEYYYQKSYDRDIALGTVTDKGSEAHGDGSVDPTLIGTLRFRSRMRVEPSVLVYCPGNGLVGRVENNSVCSIVSAVGNVSETGYTYNFTVSNGGTITSWHWVADARIF